MCLSDLEAEVAPGAAGARRRAASSSASPFEMRADTDGKYARYQLNYSLTTTHYSLLLLSVHHSLLTTTTHCSPHSLLTTHYPLLTAHHTHHTHYSLLTTHYSLLTTHYSLLSGVLHWRYPFHRTTSLDLTAKGTYESVAFLSSCNIPASVNWHFFQQG